MIGYVSRELLLAGNAIDLLHKKMFEILEEVKLKNNHFGSNILKNKISQEKKNVGNWNLGYEGSIVSL